MVLINESPHGYSLDRSKSRFGTKKKNSIELRLMTAERIKRRMKSNLASNHTCASSGMGFLLDSEIGKTFSESWKILKVLMLLMLLVLAVLALAFSSFLVCENDVCDVYRRNLRCLKHI
jgi:hypothetical protein